MTERFKKDFHTAEKRRLIYNFFSLSLLQGINYILPLITLPYLVRVLGPGKFGLIAFAQAFIQYFNMLTDYGFALSATREISIHRKNKDKVSEIFSAVMIIKFGLLVVSLAILSVIILVFKKFYQNWELYYLTFGVVIGQMLNPLWFFQGVESMKYVTLLEMTAKFIFTVCIFIFIHDVSDYIYVPLINSLGFITAGVLALWIVFKHFKLTFKCPSIGEIRHQLKEGWHIFISTVAISLYTTSNTFILGLFANNTIVGYYSAAEKLIKAAQGLLRPVSQTIYPYISKLVKESREKSIKFIQKITLFVGGATFILSAFIFVFANIIVSVILGSKYIGSVPVLRILSPLPFMIGLSNVFGIQTMLTFNYKKAFSNILISASVINIVLAFILVPYYKEIGISFSVLISETFVTTSMFVYLQLKGIKVLEGKIVS